MIITILAIVIVLIEKLGIAAIAPPPPPLPLSACSRVLRLHLPRLFSYELKSEAFRYVAPQPSQHPGPVQRALGLWKESVLWFHVMSWCHRSISHVLLSVLFTLLAAFCAQSACFVFPMALGAATSALVCFLMFVWGVLP